MAARGETDYADAAMPHISSRVFGVELAPSTDPSRVLHVVILHDDHSAFVRAARMLATTFSGRPEETRLRSSAWQFEELSRTVWLNQSIDDAPQATVIVISTSAGGELPPSVSRWLMKCFSLRQNLPTAVVALCDSLDGLEVPWRRLLHEATASAGFDFLEAGTPLLAPAA